MNANLEEAASIAAEYVSSKSRGFLRCVYVEGNVFSLTSLTFLLGLDNLPGETQHLLAEIRHRDLRTQGKYGNGYYGIQR